MRVVKVVPVQTVEPVPVFDIEVAPHHNFKIHNGVFVHNSKDIADAVCGAYTTLLTRRSSWRDVIADEQGAADARQEFEARFEADGRA